MANWQIFYLSLVACVAGKCENFELVEVKNITENKEFSFGKFPTGFKWGVATSAYQVEGGWNADGKGPSIWDTFVHRNPSPILDGSTGDTACDSYHKYKEDVQLLKSLEADFYRFSLSWSRILPDGTIAKVNQAGIDYYNDLIDELVKHGIEPVVTLHHYDTPEGLMTLGGWPNEALIQHFVDYARLAFQNFGDRVKRWITFNEPFITCIYGYGNGGYAPGIVEPIELPYKCAHTIIKAHAKAYRIYEAEFKVTQKGQIGFTVDTGAWFESLTDKPEDISATERAREFQYGWFANPLIFGAYPPIMRKMVDDASVLEGRNVSRLPHFDSMWSFIIKGSVDFFGINHYTTDLVEFVPNGSAGWLGDQQAFKYRSNWIIGQTCSISVKPLGFRAMLNWIKTHYGNPEVLVTENGYCGGSSSATGTNDTERISYFDSYIKSLLKAVVLDGCNVVGYTAWTLLDNFEWQFGYTSRYGIHFVDFTQEDRPRIPRASAKFLKQIFQNNGFKQDI